MGVGSGVAREQVGARTLGRRPWGPWGRRHWSTLFALILNVFLSRNLDQSTGQGCELDRILFEFKFEFEFNLF